ncbi:MAG: putative DNA alkylation repair enzyme [Parcubacteria group bacterium LiPW_15]|nr:MAG: putative DNA alkylation repair enzyme [Parcubacteria group bacterium LiPW_15]
MLVRSQSRKIFAEDIRRDLRAHADPKKAKLLAGFFKTGKGEYGEGDKFIGVMVPATRGVVKKYKDVKLPEALKLLRSRIHEERLAAVLLLVSKYESGGDKEKIAGIYLKNAKYINNWDLVDLSAPRILGSYFLNRSRQPLYKFAGSKDLWERRISILSTLGFIVRGEYKDTFRIAEILLRDEHDLIHKAVGWMLREVGKRVSQKAEEDFLKKRYKKMPRTMLRYAIERFPEARRKAYLNGRV